MSDAELNLEPAPHIWAASVKARQAKRKSSLFTAINKNCSFNN